MRRSLRAVVWVIEAVVKFHIYFHDPRYTFGLAAWISAVICFLLAQWERLPLQYLFLIGWVGSYIPLIVYAIAVGVILVIAALWKLVRGYAYAESAEVEKSKVEDKPKNEDESVTLDDGELSDEAVEKLFGSR